MKRLIMVSAAIALALAVFQFKSEPADAASLMVPSLGKDIAIGAAEANKIVPVRHRRRHRGRNLAIGIGAAILGAAILSGAARSRRYDYCWRERICRPVEHCWWRNGYERCRIRDHCRLVTVCD